MSLTSTCAALLVPLSFSFAAATTATPTQPAPGTRPVAATQQRAIAPQAAAAAPSGLQVAFAERGRLSQAVAAAATPAGGSTQITVTKPTGASVRKAYLATATTGFTNARLTTPISLQGQPVPISGELPNGISSYNYLADVTSLVAATINSAPAGGVSLRYAEPSADDVDGSILVVVFDNPNVKIDQSVAMLYGALSPAGDTYRVALTAPIVLTDPALRLEMSLGISYSAQSATNEQFSTIDVNGQRLTSSAGGEDDGFTTNGGLITAGGEGDSLNNPSAQAAPTNPRSDDELYDLRPFVKSGDRTLTISTNNPSLDDNVFLAAFTMNPPISSLTTGTPTANKFVALGDSYSSGFGVAPYEPGTHTDQNDCQRSTRAYSQLVREEQGIPAPNFVFRACQGAVTQHFYSPRNSTWGEKAQLDYLDAETGLVTFSIGGNDAKFATVLRDCIDGWELLPFNTCHGDARVTNLVQEAMDRLDGKASTPKEITPYSTLYSDVRARAGRATAVAVGYPHFYSAEGNDRTFLPGGRCEGVKKADQRWMVEKIDELNGIIENNARRNGFLFANPNPRFDGHELCGSSDEWIFPILSSGRIHPTADGHRSIADSIKTTLTNDGFEHFVLTPGQTKTFRILVNPRSGALSIVTQWPGSDVSINLASPSGRLITRSTSAADVTRVTGPTFERVEVAAPEAGEWQVRVAAEDVAASGEKVTLSTYVSPVPNQRPTAAFTAQATADGIRLDAAGSHDPDGQIVSYNWYVADKASDTVKTGRNITIPKSATSGRAITLVVTDDRGLTDFADLRMLPIDVMPGSSVNPIKLSSKGSTPIAILGTDSYDVRLLDTSKLTVGPTKTSALGAVSREDINGDGLIDLVIHPRTQDLGLNSKSTQLCVSGVLTDTSPFTSCDNIRAM